jgi:exopolyphosphatase/guanosine-5'-triphosphate,3'-diphosphate pyrophosphatase
LKVYLVRHARAAKRPEWKARDEWRPLVESGRRQSFGLAKLVEDEPIARLISSPSLRCRQTLLPLAHLRRMHVDEDQRLHEGEPVAGALELLRDLGRGTAVVCSHGDVIPAVLAELARSGVELDDDKLRCPKGSIWLLEGPGRDVARARFIAPVEEARAGDWPLRGDELRVAVLDLGSTSFHLLVADAQTDGALRRVTREREMLRLGSVLARGPRIPPEMRAAALEAALRLRDIADEHLTELLLPVATAALREAENGGELARAIGQAVGAPVRLLSGEEEARLIFSAFRRRLELPRGGALGVDLGGGSLELAFGDRDGVSWETTLRLGVTRLHSELCASDPLAADERKALRARVRDLVGPHAARVRRLEPEVAVATGGTINALARRILVRRSGRAEGSLAAMRIPLAELAELADELGRSTHEERLRTPGIDERRADLLPTGAAILHAVAEELDLDGYVVSDWGLREGVLLEALGVA